MGPQRGWHFLPLVVSRFPSFLFGLVLHLMDVIFFCWRTTIILSRLLTTFYLSFTSWRSIFRLFSFSPFIHVFHLAPSGVFLLFFIAQKLLEQLGDDNDSLAKDGPSFSFKIDSDCRGINGELVLFLSTFCRHLSTLLFFRLSLSLFLINFFLVSFLFSCNLFLHFIHTWMMAETKQNK